MYKQGGTGKCCLGSCQHHPYGSPGVSKGSTLIQGALCWGIHTVLDAPVHDVANEGAGEKTQQLHDAKDGRVELNWARREVGSGCQQLGGCCHPPPAEEDCAQTTFL